MFRLRLCAGVSLLFVCLLLASSVFADSVQVGSVTFVANSKSDSFVLTPSGLFANSGTTAILTNEVVVAFPQSDPFDPLTLGGSYDGTTTGSNGLDLLDIPARDLVSSALITGTLQTTIFGPGGSRETMDSLFSILLHPPTGAFFLEPCSKPPCVHVPIDAPIIGGSVVVPEPGNLSFLLTGLLILVAFTGLKRFRAKLRRAARPTAAAV
jgi:hypothetical protein